MSELNLDKLVEAMELHGDYEGTEAQLEDATSFLQQLFDQVSATEQRRFLDSKEVREFIEREG